MYHVTYTSASGEGRIKAYRSLAGAMAQAQRLPGFTNPRVWDAAKPIGSRLVWAKVERVA